MKPGRATAIAAVAAGAAVSAMIFASRLPPSLDFILPRRAGFRLFSRAHEALSNPWGRSIFTWTVALVFLAGLIYYLLSQKWTVKPRIYGRLFRAAVSVLLFRWSLTIWLEVSQRALYPFGSLHPAEPFVNFAVLSVLIFSCLAAVSDSFSAKPSPWPRTVVPWSALNAIAALMAFGFFNAWTGTLGRRAETRRFYVVLAEEGGKPSSAAYDVPIEGSSDWLRAVEDLAGSAAVQRLEALRMLYEERAKALDAQGLLRALKLGARRGDDLARSLLLEHASSAPPSAAVLEGLAFLADERVHRVGPLGAARLASAFARQGDAVRAEEWARKAGNGPRGIPRGLLELPRGGALKPGRIAGKAAGLKPELAALYRRRDPASPYLLDAGAFAASVPVAQDGRFAFTGLSEGRYYLAFAFRAGEKPRGEIRVLGHRGDVVLDARRPKADLPPYTLKSTP